jgi:hypothetical protein
MTPIHLVEVTTKLAFLEHTDEPCCRSSTKAHAYTIIVFVVLEKMIALSIMQIKKTVVYIFSSRENCYLYLN